MFSPATHRWKRHARHTSSSWMLCVPGELETHSPDTSRWPCNEGGGKAAFPRLLLSARKACNDIFLLYFILFSNAVNCREVVGTPRLKPPHTSGEPKSTTGSETGGQLKPRRHSRAAADIFSSLLEFNRFLFLFCFLSASTGFFFSFSFLK